MLNKYGEDIISEEIEPHPRYKFLFVTVAFLLILLPAASASSVGAKNVHITSEYVKATAVCSCGLNGYHYITASFENYCPQCHNHGTLSYNPKGVPEGEWTCEKCSSDYCAADGKEKMPGTNYYLKHYTAPESSQSKNIEVHAQQVTTELLKLNLKDYIAYYNGKNFLNKSK